MAITPAQLLKAKLDGIKTTLSRTPPSEKKNHVSLVLSEDFNGILKAIAQQYPDIASALPAQLPSRGFGSNMGVGPVSFLDLEALTEQVLNLLKLTESE